jgi:tetratricopeptide (TPR) repeat protein
VEDHPDPIGELARLVVVARAFEHAGRGLDLLGEMRFPEAMEEFDRAVELAPGDDQLAFFRATVLPAVGRPLDAREELDRIRRIEPRWGPFLWRGAKVGMGPNDPDFLQALAPLDPEDRP